MSNRTLKLAVYKIPEDGWERQAGHEYGIHVYLLEGSISLFEFLVRPFSNNRFGLGWVPYECLAPVKEVAEVLGITIEIEFFDCRVKFKEMAENLEWKLPK